MRPGPVACGCPSFVSALEGRVRTRGCFPSRLLSPPSPAIPAPSQRCSAGAGMLGVHGPGTSGLRARVRRDLVAGVPLSSRGGPQGTPGPRRARRPASEAGVRGDEGLGRGGAGRAAGEVISLPPPPPPLRSPPPPLRARPPRPAAAAAAASASQTRSGSGSEAGVRGGWAGSPSGGRSAGKPGRPALAPRLRLRPRLRPRLRRPRPPVPALPGRGRGTRAGSAARPCPLLRAGRLEPHPGRALGSGAPRTGAGRGREAGGPDPDR